MRYLLLGSLVLAGCGSVAVTPTPDPTSEQACVTSLYCPANERCDEGKCVADTICPEPAAPRLLFESTSYSPFPGITFMNGREYVLLNQTDGEAANKDTNFTDLATGATSVLHHAPGTVYCGGTPLICTLSTLTFALTFLTDLTLDAASGVWSAGSSRDAPVGYDSNLGTLPDGDLILSGEGMPTLLAFNLATGQSKPLVALGERSPMWALTLPTGPVLTAATHSIDGAELWSAPLADGASWTSILKLSQSYKFTGVSIPAGDGWFVVADVLPAGIPHVWHVSPAGTVDVGASDDSLLTAVAYRYASGEASLEGTQGKGLVCKGSTCQSGVLDLATLAHTPLGSVTLPGVTLPGVASLGVLHQRWLNCETVDAVVKEPIFPPDDPKAKAVGFRLYAIRVPADIEP
jgi:hypothetical protein